MWRVWAGLLIACGAGVAPAQWATTGGTPPPARPAAQPASDVLVQKTAGQPERRLRLLKVGNGPDGERFADLQDVATGAKFTVPYAALAGMKRATDVAPPSPPPPPAAKPAGGGKFPTSLAAPEPSPGGYSPFAAKPIPLPETRPQPKSRWGDLPPTVAPPPIAPPPIAPPQPVTATPPMPVAPPQPMPATLPQPVPAVAGSLDTPLTALVAAPAQPVQVAAPPVAEPPPAVALPTVAEPPAVLRMSFPAAPAYAPPSPSWPPGLADQMRAETEPYAHDLTHALRPSLRERAATALFNGRHASHPEVKQLLAQVAATDPAPTVQAHCVRLLSALGYHSREHVEFLESAAGSDHAGLRQAANTALAKLTPR